MGKNNDENPYLCYYFTKRFRKYGKESLNKVTVSAESDYCKYHQCEIL